MYTNAWTRSTFLALLVFFTGCGGGSGDGIPQTMTLNVTPMTPSEAFLDWTPHPETVTGYDIVRNGTAAYPYHLAGTSYTDNDLQPLTRYCYVIYAVEWPVGTVGQSNTVCITTPGTAGWHIETLALGNSPGLALDFGNQPHVSYRNSNGVILTYLSGGNWTSAIVDNDAGNMGDTDVAVDASNADHISHYDSINHQLIYSTNASGVWISAIVAPANGYANAISLDGAGHAHMVYSNGGLRYATNAMGDWQTESITTDSPSDADVLIDAAGVVHVAFTASTGTGCVVEYMNNQDGTWQGQIIDTDSYCGAAMALDSAGNVHIAYSRKFALLHAYNSSGNWQTELLDTFSWIGGDRVGLAIDNADHLHIAYRDQNADLKYISNVSGVWTRSFIDSLGTVGGDPDIAVDANGKVRIVYTDLGNGTIKLATSP